jgi:glycosyltransferase involved in cell wall biosynthesis
MRVLHLYSGNLYGGIETLLVLLARDRALCPDMEPHFGLCFEGRLSQELEEAGATVHLLGNVRLRNPIAVWRARRGLSRLVGAERYDVIVSHSSWVNAVLGPVLRAADAPLVQWLHNPPDDGLADRLGRRTTPRLVACNSQYTASTASTRFAGSEIDWMYSPVRLSTPPATPVIRAAVRAELATPTDAIVVVQASRLEAWKGHRAFVDALGRLRQTPGWVAWMLGGAQRPFESRYLTQLRDRVESLGIADRVRFVGERNDVGRVLAAADIYCQPNLEPEPFGIVFVEALAAGLPVVSTDLGGAREIVDSSCGILVPMGDVMALASALERLFRDGDTRHALGRGGPTRARRLCDPATQLAKMFELLTRVAKSSE